jgi:hypothetical protein
MPAISLLSSATNNTTRIVHKSWPALNSPSCYLTFQQRSTDFLNFIASMKLCVANTALHGCTLNQVDSMGKNEFTCMERGHDMSRIWNPTMIWRLVGISTSLPLCWVMPQIVIKRCLYSKLSDKANQLPSHPERSDDKLTKNSFDRD